VGVLHVLRQPDVLRVLTLSMLARLPLGTISLLLLLRVTSAGANYAQAGALGGCFGIALGVGQPLWSRYVDRRGQPPVLVTTGFVAAAFFVVLAVIPSATPLWAWFVLAALGGLAQPPMGGAMRALWDLLLHTEEERHVGYAVDASAFEIVFTIGPLIIVGIIVTLAGPTVALLVGAALVAFASAGFARSRPSRAWRPEAHDGVRSPFGALASPAVRTLLVISLGLGGCFGAIEVALAAYGRAENNTALIGVLLAVWSLGSVVGGLMIARCGRATNPTRRLLWMLAALTLGNALLGLMPSSLTLGLMLVAAGVWIAPIFATASLMFVDVAPAGMLTETFGWMATATTVGMTILSPIAGHLVDVDSPAAALAASAVPVALALGVVALRRGTLSAAGGARAPAGA
jgi:MFS family permease